MTGPEVTPGADLQHLPATMLQPVSFDDSLDDSLVTAPKVATDADLQARRAVVSLTVGVIRLTAERDQARRVAASLEADLARILDAHARWAESNAANCIDAWDELAAAIEAAREWVGRDTE